MTNVFNSLNPLIWLLVLILVIASTRALAAAACRRGGRVLMLAPTGKAVDVAVREGAGDTG